MTESQRCLFRYYEFAEQCSDDFDVMARAIKMMGCKKKPNIIKKQLEDASGDKCYMTEFAEYFNGVTQEIICSAKWHVQMERKEQLTLF